MRLLDVYKFPPPPPKDKYTDAKYAILSHTWGDDEVIYEDLFHPDLESKKSSWDKIRGAQAKARKRGLKYIWIDTLCIDKSSSAELGEAVNSMYRWYQEAEICYVYLEDVDSCPRLYDNDVPISSYSGGFKMLQESRWFTRGWTLQELIAPTNVCFFDQSWNFIGPLKKLKKTISNIAKIHAELLAKASRLEDFSVAQRLSWAAGRKTTRPEDEAYSLLDILGVSMDIRYGEGRSAFIRLQKELIGLSMDQSLFAWDFWDLKHYSRFMPLESRRMLLADSPNAFKDANNIVPTAGMPQEYTMTNQGLHITAPVIDDSWIVLSCCYDEDPTTAILLSVSLITIPGASNNQYAVFPRHSNSQSNTARLRLLDSDEAVARSKERNLIILSDVVGKPASGEFRLIAQSSPHHRKLWLRIEAVDGLDKPRLLDSKPGNDTHPDKLIWSINAHSEYFTIIMHFAISERKATLQVVLRRCGLLEGSLKLMDFNAHPKSRWSTKALPLSYICTAGNRQMCTAELSSEILSGVAVYILRVRASVDHSFGRGSRRLSTQ